MLTHALAHATQPHGAALLGVAAHVYADTFSHCGFSGISSRLNLVDDESIHYEVSSTSLLDYITLKAIAFRNKYTADIANTLTGLGHGGVATLPDRPYLVWQFRYEHDTRPRRCNNPATFLEACEKLHALFVAYRQHHPAAHDASIPVTDFDALRETVRQILKTEGKLAERIQAWQAAMHAGHLGNSTGETIPDYTPATFADEITRFPTQDAEAATQTLTYQFMRAAQIHRHYVLDTLLPTHGIRVMLP